MTDAHREAPWYVEVFLAIGGWVAGLIVAIAIFFLVGALVVSAGDRTDINDVAIISLVIGAGFAVLGTGISGDKNGPSKGDFNRHFAIALITAGLTTATGGAWYLLYQTNEPTVSNEILAGAYSGIITATFLAGAGWLAVRRTADSILAFLTTLAVYGVLFATSFILSGNAGVGWPADHYLSAFCVALGCWLFVGTEEKGQRLPCGAALMIGPMLSDAVMSKVGAIAGATENHQNFLIVEMLQLAAAFYALTVLRDRYRLAPLVATATLVATAVWLLPIAGGVAIIILLAGVAANHRGLSIIGVFAVAWFISRFYYELSMTLLEKSAVLVGLGAVTIAGTLFFNRVFDQQANSNETEIKTTGSPRRNLYAIAGFGVLLALALGYINRGVWRLEYFHDAQEVYFALGPRDPRSIIQGDYMVLGYRADIYPPIKDIGPLAKKGEIILRLDKNRVASFARIGVATSVLDADELRIDYIKTSNTRLRYVPESYFFQEGEAPVYAAARFAIVRVASDGRARLVGLADEGFIALGGDWRAYAPPS